MGTQYIFICLYMYVFVCVYTCTMYIIHVYVFILITCLYHLRQFGIPRQRKSIHITNKINISVHHQSQLTIYNIRKHVIIPIILEDKNFVITYKKIKVKITLLHLIFNIMIQSISLIQKLVR